MDIQKQKELYSAYLCLKDSAADDLLSYSEVKHALHYAGYNPTTEFLEKVWVEGETERITFTEFCDMTEQISVVDEAEVKRVISNVFIVNGDSILLNDLKSLLLMSKRETNISSQDIDSLVQEVGGENGQIKVSDLCAVVNKTADELKQISLQDFDEKAFQQRINSRTFTKKEVPMTFHSYGGITNIDVKDWFISNLKGSLFIDEKVIISHQYALEIPFMGPTVIKIMPLKFKSTVLNVDLLAFIFRETGEGQRSYLGYTNMKGEDGSNYWMDTLKEGRYIIIPYTNGCIKKKTKDESKVLQILNTDDKIELTSDCKAMLEDIFYQMDLDGNGFLNRQEFNLYNWRTSGEIVQDDEWEIVQKNFDVENGEITLKGFISLHQLEAEDNGGDSEDLWLSLENVGYNRYGYQDKCSPFSMIVYCQAGSAVLYISALKSGGLLLDKAVICSVMEEAEAVPICGRSELVKFEFKKNLRAGVVIQNKSSESVEVRIDCSESENVFSNRDSLIWEGVVDGKSAIVAHHLSAINSQKPWLVRCKETIIE